MHRRGWTWVLILAGCNSSEAPSREPEASPKPAVAPVEPTEPKTPEETQPPPTPPAPPPIHDVWFASDEGSLVRIDETGAMDVAWAAQTRLGDLVVGPAGDVWASQRRQVRRYRRDGFDDLAEAPWLVSDFSVGADGTVWALGFNKVASHNAGSWTEVDPAKLEAMKLDHIADVFVDANGAPWLVGRGGVVRGSSDGKFEKIEPPAVETFRPAHFARAHDGTLILAHFDGISGRVGESWETLDLKGGASSTRAPAIRTVAFNRSGDFAFSDYASRCVSVDAEGYRLVTDRDRLKRDTPALEIRAVALDGKRRAWIATDAGVVADGRTFWASQSLPGTQGKISHIVARGDGPTKLPEVDEPPSGSIQGTLVVDGKPGANLWLEICNDPARSLGSLGSPCEIEDPSGGGKTDADGRFTVEGLPPGRYELAVNLGNAQWKVVCASSCCMELPADLGRIEVSRGAKVTGMSQQELEDMEAFEAEMAEKVDAGG